MVILTCDLRPKKMTPPQPGPKEIFLQALNLADEEVKVTVLGDENNILLEESIRSFQVRYGLE